MLKIWEYSTISGAALPSVHHHRGGRLSATDPDQSLHPRSVINDGDGDSDCDGDCRGDCRGDHCGDCGD